MKEKIILSMIFLSIISFTIGVISSNDLLFLKNYISEKQIVKEIPQYSNDEILDIINIKSKNDIEIKRKNLNIFLWDQESLPNKFPDRIEKYFDYSKFSNINNLNYIEKITTSMEYDFYSISYLLHPLNPNNNLIIYHEGHNDDLDTSKKNIQFFLTNGYSVLFLNMPLMGDNPKPFVTLSDSQKIQILKHNQLIFLENENFSPMKFFLEPIVVSLNYVEKEYSFKNFYMFGISGGGWTTTIYSAIDERIKKSFSISGSLPLFLRTNIEDVGDYEQINPDFYAIANYLDLYIMSSFGSNREHTEIYIDNDPCCFSGSLYEVYSPSIYQKIDELGIGKFNVISDPNSKTHEISTEILKIILINLNKT